MSADQGGARLRAPVALPENLGTFLFADAGSEPGGMALTTLSALARLGLDPWDEAGRLARLPHRQAAGELARSLAALPGTALPDPAGAAARLAALLPGRAAALPGSLAAPEADVGLQVIRRQATVLAAAAVLTVMALLLGGYMGQATGSAAASKPPSAVAGPP